MFFRAILCFKKLKVLTKATLREKCVLRENDNVQGQILVHIRKVSNGYCIDYPLSIFVVSKRIYCEVKVIAFLSLSFSTKLKDLRNLFWSLQ